jgi:hypothetical protein
MPTTERSVDSGRGSAFSASQQQADRDSLTQQERVALLVFFAEQADASPTTESIPVIAARTMEASRR